MKLKRSDLSKIGMTIFLSCIIVFVSISSIIYFNNTSDVEIQIQSDDEIKKEKTAINEALTKTIHVKNDSLLSIKTELKKYDSLHLHKIASYELRLSKLQQKHDSLHAILKRLKKSDIEPVTRPKNN